MGPKFIVIGHMRDVGASCAAAALERRKAIQEMGNTFPSLAAIIDKIEKKKFHTF